MKRVLSLLIVFTVALSLVACGNENVKTTETEATEKSTSQQQETHESTETTVVMESISDETIAGKPKSGIYDDSAVVGNFRFPIPEGFSANKLKDDDNAIFFSSSDMDCHILLAAVDISNIAEEDLDRVFRVCKETLSLEKAEILEEDEIDISIADKAIKGRTYIKQDENYDFSICMDTYFTDSWYSYIIQMEMDSDTDKVKEYSRKFAYFTNFAEYFGEQRRFETMQDVD